MKKLKPGYYWCVACRAKTLHGWYSGLTNQEFETYPSNVPIPEDVFLCTRCQSENENENL